MKSYFGQECFYISNGYLVSEFSPYEVIQDTGVIIIPSGGLTGLWYNESLRSRLQEFTNLGGTVICFDQQYGYNYGILPVPDGCAPIGGLGWAEAQSCFNQSTRVYKDHPMLASCTTEVIDAGVDGYFKSFPDNSCLLRSRQSGYPVLIAYECGAGFVVASTLYGDWAFANYQAGVTETRLFRDIIAWSIDREPHDVKIDPDDPDPDLSFIYTDIELANPSTDEPARYAEVNFQAPDRIPAIPDPTPEVFDLGYNLLPGQSTLFDYSNEVGPEEGIYWIDIQLLNQNMEPIQDAASDKRVAFRTLDQNTTYGFGGPDFYVLDEHIAAGSSAVFIIEAGNCPFFQYTTSGYHVVIHGISEPPIELSGGIHDHETRQFVVDDVTMDIRAWMTLTYNSTAQWVPDPPNTPPPPPPPKYINLNKGVTVFQPEVTADIIVEETPVYIPGTTIPFSNRLHNLSQSATDVHSRVWLTSQNGTLVFGPEDYDLSLAPNATHTQEFYFDSSSFCESATCRGQAVFIHSKVYGSSEFSTIGSDLAQIWFDSTYKNLSVFHQAPESGYHSGPGNQISFGVTPGHTYSCSSQFSFNLKVFEPESNLVTIQIQQTIPAIQMNQPFDVVFSNVDFGSLLKGNYRFACDIVSNCSPEPPLWSGEFLVPNEPFITGSFDKASYRVRDDITFALKASNRGYFSDTYHVEISGLDLTPTPLDIPLPAHARTPTPYYLTTTVVEDVEPGLQEVRVETINQTDDRDLVSEYYYLIPDSFIIPDLQVSEVQAGQTVPVEYTNFGGIDTECTAHVKLTGPFRNELVTEIVTDPFSVLAGSEYLQNIPIPGQTVTGFHQFQLMETDLNNSIRMHIREPLFVDGISAEGILDLDDPYYHTIEPINTSITFNSTGHPISGAELLLWAEKATNKTVSAQWIGDAQLMTGMVENLYPVNPNGVKTYGPAGFWTGLFDSRLPRFDWTDLSWSGLVPPSTGIGIRVKTADTMFGLADAHWIPESPKSDYFELPGFDVKWNLNPGSYSGNDFYAPGTGQISITCDGDLYIEYPADPEHTSFPYITQPVPEGDYAVRNLFIINQTFLSTF